MAEPTRTRAHVRVLLEIDLPDRWGDECPLSQVYRQGKREAIDLLRRVFDLGDGLKIAGYEQATFARAIAEPEIVAVIATGKETPR